MLPKLSVLLARCAYAACCYVCCAKAGHWAASQDALQVVLVHPNLLRATLGQPASLQPASGQSPIVTCCSRLLLASADCCCRNSWEIPWKKTCDQAGLRACEQGSWWATWATRAVGKRT